MTCTLPVDLGACESLIGTLLHSPESFDDIASVVRPEDVLDARSRVVFEAARSLHNEGKPVSVTSVAERLGTRLEECGGPAGLIELMNRGDAAHNAAYHARIVRSDADRVRLLQELETTARQAKDRSRDLSEVLAEARTRIDAVEDGRGDTDGPVACREGITEVCQHLADDAPEVFVPSGFDDLDSLLAGGFRAGELIVLAARPGMGKSALAGNVAAHAAQRGIPTMLFSLEQPRREVLQRMLSSESRIAHDQIRRRDIRSELEVFAIGDASSRIAKWPLWIDEKARRTVGQIGAVARRHKRRHGLGLVLIDYLQLISPEDARVNREQQVAVISRSLKLLAQDDLGVPVIVLAQLNRQVETRDDKRPRLSDLRESGSIEQDADAVLFVDRPAEYDRNALPTDAMLYLRKNRHGQRGQVKLRWAASTLTFQSELIKTNSF